MSEKSLGVLFLAADRRVELIKAFKTETLSRNMGLKIFVADCKPELASASYFADHFFKSPLTSDLTYIDFILDLCKKNNIHLEGSLNIHPQNYANIDENYMPKFWINSLADLMRM